MATQSFIIYREHEIRIGKLAIENARDAYLGEVQRDGSGRGYPENHDVWGTLRVNAIALRNAADRLIRSMDAEFPE